MNHLRKKEARARSASTSGPCARNVYARTMRLEPRMPSTMTAESTTRANVSTARAVLTFALVVLSAVMVLGILGSSLIVRAYTFRAHGPEVEAERALASFFLKWFMPQIVFYGLGAGVATR